MSVYFKRCILAILDDLLNLHMVFKTKLRWVLAYVALVLSIAAFVFAISHKYLQIDTLQRFNAILYTDLTKSGIDLETGESDKFFDLALVLVGTLAGLVLAKPDEARITLADKQELLVFIAAVLLLTSSGICHVFYLSAVSDACLEAKVDREKTLLTSEQQPDSNWRTETVVTSSQGGSQYAIEEHLMMEDVRDPGIEYLLTGQEWFFTVGFILSCVVLVSANWLKEKSSPDPAENPKKLQQDLSHGMPL